MHSNMMQANYELVNNTLLLRGTITVNTAGNLFTEIKKMFVSQAHFNKIDCSQLEFVDSAAISLLMSCLREANNINREIDIVGMGDKLSDLASLYEVSNILNC